MDLLPFIIVLVILVYFSMKSKFESITDQYEMQSRCPYSEPVRGASGKLPFSTISKVI